MKRLLFSSTFLLAILILQIPATFAIGDSFKPYLHTAAVPKHPELKVYGSYATDLFPGAATYSYKLEVPPGTNGLAPSLSLSYNSEAARQSALLGSGWSLSEDSVLRDVNGTISNQSDDIFILSLNGQNYKLAYDSTRQFFHTFTESYAKVENLTTGGQVFWLVTTKDGTQYRFGFTSDARLSSDTGQGYVVQWYLDTITDTHANNVTYAYRQNPFSGDLGAVYLHNITYNNDKKRVVLFNYESINRPDYRAVYREGDLKNVTRRLTGITIKADGSQVRRYAFAYTTLNNESSVTALANVTFVGADNTSLLHVLKFGYYSSEVGYYKNTTAWFPPELFANGQSTDLGLRLVDVNNDGLLDVVKARGATFSNKTWLNNKKDGWQQTAYFEVPAYVTNNADKDFGVRFEDLNNDGFTDVLKAVESDGWDKEWINNGTGWVEQSATWDLPSNIAFVSGLMEDLGVQFGDLNGDGWTDIVRGYSAGGSSVFSLAYINTGSGWKNATSQIPPVNFIGNDGTKDMGARFVDFNGDGYTDIIRSIDDGNNKTKEAWLNTGTSWVNASHVWDAPEYFVSQGTEQGMRFMDVNGDGLLDMFQSYANASGNTRRTWLNTGHGWANASGWEAPDHFTEDGYNIGRRVADVDGDGFPDFVASYSNGTGTPDYNYTWFKNATTPYLLRNITNEFGAFVEISYTDSSQFNNSGSDSISDLGFNIKVVGGVKQNGTLNNAFNVLAITNYSFFGGVYNWSRKEFRGFSLVNESLPDGTEVRHYFHQDDILKGKEYKTETYNSSMQIFAREEKNFRPLSNGSFFYVFLDNTSSWLYDGNNTNPRTVNVSYGYDGYGNIIGVNYSGGGKRERYEYYSNTSSWIHDRMKRSQLFDGDTAVQEALYSYDGKLNQGPQKKGELTRVDRWLSQGASTGTHTTFYTYDSFGNVITETDPLGRVTQYDYGIRDDTNTFRDEVTNPLGHVTNYNYDLGTGNLEWQEKNGIRDMFYYDTFGRIVKEVRAYDSYNSPTKEYNYTFDGVAPESIQVSQKYKENGTFDIVYFYDGFGNLIQMRSDAEQRQDVVKDFFYDARSRVSAESIPHFETEATTLSTASSSYTNYTYDPLSRVIRVTNPDATNITITFDRDHITARDANNHRKAYVIDSYDRISNVYEYNNDPLLNNMSETLYNTSYVYDVMDNVKKITDTQGHVFSFRFDSLGRRISLSDPDLGNWTYGYDVAGNLISQTDARGYATNFTYDDLNRPKQKISNTTTFTFAYDGQYLGTLTNITDGSMTYAYTYDDRYRVTNQKLTTRGTTFDTGFGYDAMDRMVAERFLNNDPIGYNYNAQGLIDKIGDVVNKTAYNAFGNPLNKTYDNGKVMTFTYNAQTGRLTQVKTDTIQQLDYSYDSVGNIIQIDDPVHRRAQNLTYDFLDRLVNASVGGSSYRYVYDETGRVVEIVTNSSTSTSFVYDGAQAHAPSSVTDRNTGVMVYKIEEVNTSDKTRTFGFFVVNEKNITVNNASWLVDFGDGTNASNSSFTLGANGFTRFEVTRTYANGNDYKVNVTASAGGVTSATTVFDTEFGIRATNLSYDVQNVTNTTFTLTFTNDFSTAVNDVNWSCDSGSVSGRVNVSGNSQATTTFTTTQATTGWKSINCSVISTEGSNNLLKEYLVKGAFITDFNVSSVTGDKQKVSLAVNNSFSSQTVNWAVASDGFLYTGSQVLGAGASTVLTQQINYSRPGEKLVNANISTALDYDNRSATLVLGGLRIDDYILFNKTGSDRIFSYTVVNEWADNLTLRWNFTDPSIASTIQPNMSMSGTLFVLVEQNYTDTGQKNPTFMIYNSTVNATKSDTFFLAFLDVIRNTALHETVSSAISEFTVKNYLNSTQRISWRFNTQKENITSTKIANMSMNEELFGLVVYNYTAWGPGGYMTSAFVNSTADYNDTQSGVMVV